MMTLTSLFLTTMVLTILPPSFSSCRWTTSVAWAWAMTASLSRSVEMAIQINGKLRGTMQAAVDLDNDQVIALAHDTDVVKRNVEKLGGRIVKTIVVKNKLVNVIVK